MIATLRHLRPELASISVAITGVLIFIYVAKGIAPFISFLKTAASETGAEVYFLLMLKAMAISLCCRMSADICRDCGENGIASRVELAGKFGIVLISLPIVRQLFEIAKDMFG